METQLSERQSNQMDSSDLLFLTLVLLLPGILHITIKKIEANRRKKKKLPPGPPGLPVIGNLHQLGAIPHISFFQFSRKYGDVMFLHLGKVPTVIISSAEAAKEILKAHDLKACSRPLLTGTGKLSYYYRDIAFTPYGHYWRDLRKVCVLELFSLKRVESFQSVREEEVSLMIDSIFKSSSASSLLPVDLSEKCLSLTANVVCRVAFGKSFQERGFERFQEIIHEGLAMLGSFYSADFFPYVGWIIDRISGLHSRLEKNFQEFDAFYQKIIDDHIKKDGHSGADGEEDIIDVLLEFERSQNESAEGIQFSKDHIKAILMNIFLAGVDTGSIVLVWAMSELVKNPRVMKKAQKEIRNYMGSKAKVSETDISKFGYLKMVLKETLRLHPPSTLLIPRETMSQFNINGYEIYPKTRIQVNVWAIGKDPKVWKNPEEFYPERFIDSHPIPYQDQHNYEILAFGGGRRGCPGVSMGMALVELALANLLLCFDWKLPYNMKIEDLNMEEAFGLTTYKKEPLFLLPIRYKPLYIEDDKYVTKTQPSKLA